MNISVVDLAMSPDLSRSVKLALMDVAIGWRGLVEEAAHAVVIVTPKQFLQVEGESSHIWSYQELRRRAPEYGGPIPVEVEMATVVRGRGFLDVSCAGLFSGTDDSRFREDVIRCLGALLYMRNEELRWIVEKETPFRDGFPMAELFFVDMFSQRCLRNETVLQRENQRLVRYFERIEGHLWQHCD